MSKYRTIFGLKMLNIHTNKNLYKYRTIFGLKMFDIHTNKNLYKYGTIFCLKMFDIHTNKIGINIEQFLDSKCSIFLKTCINIGNRKIGQKNSKHDRYFNFSGISGVGITGSGIYSSTVPQKESVTGFCTLTLFGQTLFLSPL